MTGLVFKVSLKKISIEILVEHKGNLQSTKFFKDMKQFTNLQKTCNVLMVENKKKSYSFLEVIEK